LAFNYFQKKCSKGVLLSERRKVTVSKPRLPRKPPQLHHDLPPRNTPKTQKPHAKTTFPPPKFFGKQNTEN
jgi:hypothetical protein